MNLDSITADALKLKPAKVLGLVFVVPFFVVGVVLRLMWMAPALAIAAAVKGWQQSDAAYERWRGRVPGTKQP